MARQIRKKSGTGIYHIKMTGDSPVTSFRVNGVTYNGIR